VVNLGRDSKARVSKAAKADSRETKPANRAVSLGSRAARSQVSKADNPAKANRAGNLAKSPAESKALEFDCRAQSLNSGRAFSFSGCA
jgi:hypothetical protein